MKIKFKKEAINRIILYYDPCSGGKIEITSLKEFIDTSGTSSGTEKHILTASFERSISVNELKYFNASGLVCLSLIKEVFETETNNVESKGYEYCAAKREILLNINQINVSNSTDSPFVGKINDFLPALGAELKDIVHCKDYHEAANAYYYNKRFTFLISEDQLSFLFRDPKTFKDKFIKKLKDLIREQIK